MRPAIRFQPQKCPALTIGTLLRLLNEVVYNTLVGEDGEKHDLLPFTQKIRLAII